MIFYFFFKRGKARGKFRRSPLPVEVPQGCAARKIPGMEEEEKGAAGSIPAASRLESEGEAKSCQTAPFAFSLRGKKRNNPNNKKLKIKSTAGFPPSAFQYPQLKYFPAGKLASRTPQR